MTSLFFTVSNQFLGSFSNDDSDGNEDVKKAIGLLRKTQLCTCITLFCTFLHPPCTTTTLKCLIASFMEDVNERRRISVSLSKVECAPQEINFREIRLHLPFSSNWNKRESVWKTGIHFKSDVFTAVAVVDAKASSSLSRTSGRADQRTRLPKPRGILARETRPLEDSLKYFALVRNFVPKLSTHTFSP